MNRRRITPVILSGGTGTRLWPLSRGSLPKQLLTLMGEETMLQMTACRVADPALFDAPIVVAGASQAETVQAQLAAVGAVTPRMILEPCGRNTAAAIALAALSAEASAMLLVMPSDHIIRNIEAFRSAVTSTAPFADEGWLVTFGIRPGHPETGYGYIEQGERLAPGIYRADRFVEKPDLAAARRYVDDGSYMWNSGIFLFRADALLGMFARYAPDIAAGTDEGSVIRPNSVRFSEIRAQSIDHAVMEKSDRIAVAPVAMDWSDVGSWDMMFDMAEKDLDGNVTAGDILAIDSRNSLLRSEGRLVVAIGVEDLIVVETANATLILPRGESQRVREAVEALRERRHPALER